MLNAPRETLGVGLIKQGYSPNTTSQEQLDAAAEASSSRSRWSSSTTRPTRGAASSRGSRSTTAGTATSASPSRTIPAEASTTSLPSRGLHRLGRRHRDPEGDRERLCRASLPQPHARPRTGRAGADYIGYHCVVPEACSTTPTRAGGNAADAGADRQRQVRRGRRRVRAMYDEAWREVKSPEPGRPRTDATDERRAPRPYQAAAAPGADRRGLSGTDDPHQTGRRLARRDDAERDPRRPRRRHAGGGQAQPSCRRSATTSSPTCTTSSPRTHASPASTSATRSSSASTARATPTSATASRRCPSTRPTTAPT